MQQIITISTSCFFGRGKNHCHGWISVSACSFDPALAATRFPVLIAIDGINAFYSPSVFLNPKYEKKYYIDPLPPSQLTLVRCFSNFKQHGLVRAIVLKDGPAYEKCDIVVVVNLHHLG